MPQDLRAARETSTRVLEIIGKRRLTPAESFDLIAQPASCAGELARHGRFVLAGDAADLRQRELRHIVAAEAEAIVRGEQGSVSWVEVEPVLDLVSQEIGQEIQRTLDYFGTTAEHERIQRIFLSGGWALIPGLQEFLAGQWGIEVIRANPFKRVDVGGGADAGMVDKLAPLATVATGLAMRYPDDRK